MRLLALDGNSIINRAFYGIRLLSTKDGLYTNGIYGFINILNKLRESVKPDGIAIAFDLSSPTFRHLAYDGYKEGRKRMPEELAVQMPVLKKLLISMGLTVLECAGFEADDILGTIAVQAKGHGSECVIATGDRDTLQMVGDGVTVYLTTTKMGKPELTIYNEEKINEDYGILPKELIDVKALMGDSSDKIPGVAGIGTKTALDLISKFKSIDYIYANIDTLDIKEGVKNKLIADKDNAYLSRMLGTIHTEVPIDFDLASFMPKKQDDDELSRILTKLEFFKMIEKLALHTTKPLEQATQISQTNEALQLCEDLNEAVSALEKAGQADIFIEYKDGNIEAVSFVLDNIQYLITASFEKIFTVAKFRVHDSKKLFTALKNRQIIPEIAFDSFLAAYLLSPDQTDYSTDRLFSLYAIERKNWDLEKFNDLCFNASGFTTLCNILEEEIGKNEQQELLYKIEIPLAKVLFSMEREGFCVDKTGIERFGEKLAVRIAEIEKEIYEIIGYEFNLNSPKQLGEALFVKLGLSHGKKTKSGYSTGVEVLESLKYESEAVAFILEYRQLAKLKSTYCDGLLKVISENGRIHTTFKQTEARTGRISSTEPNLQNIPIRQELGRELRKFFIASEGDVLCDADYSQIELRVLAHIANDKAMIEAFNEELDIHTQTASQVFGVPEVLITPVLRSRAKAVNFGIVYGIGAFSLSKDIGVSRNEAETYINNYLKTYSGVKEYMDNVVKTAKENGYVTTIFGRRRYLPELASSNFNLRSFGERVARNMPIQGAAADIIKIAMVKVFERLQAEGLKAKLILQIHDELIVEAPEEEKEKASKILHEEMENAVQLSVQMVADVKTGKTWYDAK